MSSPGDGRSPSIRAVAKARPSFETDQLYRMVSDSNQRRRTGAPGARSILTCRNTPLKVEMKRNCNNCQQSTLFQTLRPSRWPALEDAAPDDSLPCACLFRACLHLQSSGSYTGECPLCLLPTVLRKTYDAFATVRVFLLVSRSIE